LAKKLDGDLVSALSESGDGRQHFVKELQVALTVSDVREVFFGVVPDVLHADGIGFYRFREPSQPLLLEKSATLSEAFLHNYEERGRFDDPVLDFVLEHRLPGDSARLPQERWRSSGAHEVLSGEGLAHSMEAPLIEAGEVIGTINFARASDGSRFLDGDLTSARFVSEHLSLAMERARRYEALGERSSLFQGALEQCPQGVLVNDLEGATIFANRQASELLGGKALGPNGSRLHELVSDAIGEFIAENRHAATVNVRDDRTGRRVILKSYLSGKHDSVVSIVYECPDEEAAALPAWEVLTPREQEIATLVSQGLTTRQIAAKAFVSENTVKQHLKRIFAKTDVHSRAELVQLIWAAKHGGQVPAHLRG
jgi:DNA-binding CsgD family transcriptional regulator/PAS domain-containing protein